MRKALKAESMTNKTHQKALAKERKANEKMIKAKEGVKKAQASANKAASDLESCKSHITALRTLQKTSEQNVHYCA